MKPLNLVGFNAAYQKPRGTRKGIVQKSTRLGALIAGVECKWLIISAIVDPHFTVIQQTNKGDAYAGTCLIYDPKRITDQKHVQWVVGVEPGKADMLTRYILEADVQIDGDEWRSVRVSHAPPARYFWLWGKWALNVRRSIARAEHPVWLFSDFNRFARAVVRFLGLRPRMKQIMGWAFSPGEDTSRAKGHEVGSDHLTVVVTARGDD